MERLINQMDLMIGDGCRCVFRLMGLKICFSGMSREKYFGERLKFVEWVVIWSIVDLCLKSRVLKGEIIC